MYVVFHENDTLQVKVLLLRILLGWLNLVRLTIDIGSNLCGAISQLQYCKNFRDQLYFKHVGSKHEQPWEEMMSCLLTMQVCNEVTGLDRALPVGIEIENNIWITMSCVYAANTMRCIFCSVLATNRGAWCKQNVIIQNKNITYLETEY